MIKALTFDCWRTLLRATDDPATEQHRIDGMIACLKRHGHPVAPDQISAAMNAVRADASWLQANTGQDTAIGVQVAAILRHLAVPPAPDLLKAVAEPYCEAALAFPPDPIPGAPEITAMLARNYRIGLICNTGVTPGKIVRKLLDVAGISCDRFHFMLFSDEVGMAKPHPEVYRLALQQLGLSAGEVAHVGDDLITDVRGARSVGMRAIWFADGRTGEPEGASVAQQLTDVLPLIQAPV